MASQIRILIADDHAIVREGLNALISTEAGMEIVGEANNGQDAIHLARKLKPDILLLDLMMPIMNGIEAISRISQENDQVRILALTSYADDDIVFSAIKAGALGYLLKDTSPQALLQSIRQVYQGETSLSPSIALKLVREFNQNQKNRTRNAGDLTSREIEILQYVAQGASNQEIADALHLSERTVRNHVGNILKKLHLANRTQAALYALRKGYAQLDSE